jgi:serine/threonine protein kinase
MSSPPSEVGLARPSASAAEEPNLLSVQTRYRLVRRIGAGGMAIVYQAAIERADGFSRSVALKLVREDFAQFPEFAKLLSSEAALAAKLTHPNIVGVFDYCQEKRAGSFLVMEMVNGVSLRALIHQQPPMPFPVATFVLAEVLRGLGYAHRLPQGTGLRGVLHCDISPHNILLSWEGAVKLSDFGISKALMTTSGVVTGSEMLNGKPSYMSPEQVSNASLDRRTDLFSLGVVFWEMLAGAKLFRGGSPSEVFREIATRQLPRPSLHRRVPRELENVAMKLLERDRDRRYACAEDALADLMRCRQATGNGAGELVALLSERFPPATRAGEEDTSPNLGQRATASAHPAPQAISVEVRPRLPGRRLLFAVGLAGLALGVGAPMMLWQPSAQEPSPPTHVVVEPGPASAGTATPLPSPGDLAAVANAAPCAEPSRAVPQVISVPSLKPSRAVPRSASSPPKTPTSGIVEIPLRDSSATRKR